MASHKCGLSTLTLYLKHKYVVYVELELEFNTIKEHQKGRMCSALCRTRIILS